MGAFGGFPKSGALEPAAASWRRDCLAIFLAGAALRVILLLIFPEPYGEDGFGRIYFKDRIFLSHWLPLTQVVVYLVGRLSPGAFWIRFAFALLGAGAACGFYAYLRRIVSREAALAGGLVFSFNFLAVTLSLMPYQDILFLGLHYAGMAFLFPGPGGEGILASWRGSAFYGLACLTRYEGWFALPALALWKAVREARPPSPSRTLAAAVRTAVFFGWAPSVWFLLSFFRWRGWNEFLFQTADRQFYGWHPHFDLEWALGYGWRWLYWIVRFGSPPVVLLAVWGIVLLWRRRRGLDPSLKLLLANGAVVAVFFFFIIGRGQETVFRFVTFPMSIVLVASALGLEGLLRSLRRRIVPGRRLRVALWTIALAAMAVYTAVPLARLVAEPQHRDPYRIARFLEDRLAAGERVVVSADRSRDLQDDAPLLYQRIVAQARLDRDAIEAAGNLEFEDPARFLQYARRRGVRYLVVFENFQPWRPVDVWIRQWVDSEPEWFTEVLRTGDARILRVREWPAP